MDSSRPVVFMLDLIVFSDEFEVHPNAAISGHNNVHLTNVNVDDCQRQCNKVGWCKSFDYYKNDNECDLSDKNAADVGGLRTNYGGHPYDYYERVTNNKGIIILRILLSLLLITFFIYSFSLYI